MLLQLLKNCGQILGDDKDVGMDCSIVALNNIPGNFSLVSTTDFFFPAVEDPYIQGCIGCANVLSDIYSLGISRVDTVLMLVAASSDMDQESSYKVTELMMKGFMKTAEKAHTKVTGGQTVKNAWPIIGGVATSVVQESEMIRPDNLAPGDVLVLTKPLGTQIAVNLYQKWRKSPSSIDWKITDNEILAMYNSAVASMMHLNQKAAELLKRHAAHGATDITGFGIFGHANNLARAQKRKIYIEIDTLPCLKRSPLVANEIFDSKFNLLGGTLAETSGGLLIAFPSVRKAEEFQFDLLKEDGCESWIIGTVLERFDDEVSNYAVIKKDQLKILEVFFNKTELGH